MMRVKRLVSLSFGLGLLLSPLLVVWWALQPGERLPLRCDFPYFEFSPDGRLFSAWVDARHWVMDAESGRVLMTLPDNVSYVRFAPDGKSLLVFRQETGSQWIDKNVIERWSFNRLRLRMWLQERFRPGNLGGWGGR